MTKDKEFLEWLAKRIENVYGEDHNVDFLHKVRRIAAATPKDRET